MARPLLSGRDCVRFNENGCVQMPVFESSRKVQAFGSSYAMTLPSLFVKANEVKKGSIGTIFYGLKGVLVISLNDEPEQVKHGLLEILHKINNHEHPKEEPTYDNKTE